MLAALGWRLSFGLPGSDDCVGVWGRKAVSKRGFAMAKWRNVPVTSFEDGFLRSVKTGREGAAGYSLVADDLGIYFETAKPNWLRQLILESEAANAQQLQRAENGIDLLRRNHLSKYNDFPIGAPDLPRDFVLVIDQTEADASIAGSGSGKAEFDQMLRSALEENPDLPVIVKSHPETSAGKRAGYLDPDNATARITFVTTPTSPWALFERASRVYCVSSQLGMEAIFAGHRPVVFGNAFYAGWGLSDDRHPDTETVARRSAAQLFSAAYLNYCQWYDPCFLRACEFEQTARALAAQAEALRSAKQSTICHGMRLWKRGFLRQYLGGGMAPPDLLKIWIGRFRWRGKKMAALLFGQARKQVNCSLNARLQTWLWCGSKMGSCARPGWGPSWSNRCRWRSTTWGFTTTQAGKAGWSG